MRFIQVIALAASALMVAAAPEPRHIDSDALEAFKHLNEPEELAVFEQIVNGEIPSVARREAEPEKRCCSGVCCNFDTCQEDVTFCLWYCASIVGAGQLGCIAGCYVAC